MTNFICDSAEATFDNMAEMQTFVAERVQQTEWLEEGVRNVIFDSLHDEPLCAPEYARKMGVSALAVEDTMDVNSAGLALTTSIGKRPVGWSAVKSIADRAGLMPGGFEKLRKGNREHLKTVLNLMFDVSSGAVQIKVADEKVRAVHSGRYAVINADRLLEIVKEYFDDNWPAAKFVNGYYSHELMRESINLEAYKDIFFEKLPQDSVLAGATPAFVLSSSDIATSAVKLIPCLNMGGVTVPMAKEIAIPHVGEDIEARVQNGLEKLLAYFQANAADLQALETVTVKNGKNALVRCLKTGGMPKACAGEAVEGFVAMYGTDQVTALEVYLAACDAYSYVVRDYPNDHMKIFAAADCVARVAATRWSDVDIPGEVEL